ncbi:hypothetical protein FA95DRAFT_1650771 [Auriscalpium vulgare]|uniref:Uncharacterized protein n=1 Tax=Auriscalpium vulgare TaxID=40419 RepID=A0ACB8R9A5_9AGAM|nr:hypothetical protein FA95DRAFT_1650771 [Auriscalpium vulgare]
MAQTTSFRYSGLVNRTKSSTTLKPIALIVSFQGDLPDDLVSTEVPLEISVSIPRGLASFTAPALRILPAAADVTQDGMELEGAGFESDEGSEFDDKDWAQTVSVPFLPLAQDFDVVSQVSWGKLACAVQDWLISPESCLSESHWSWGVDLFWLAFIAAYPTFPLGEWPSWNRRIPFNSPFLNSRMNIGIEGSDITEAERRWTLWQDFSRQISLFYPYPLIAT